MEHLSLPLKAEESNISGFVPIAENNGDRVCMVLPFPGAAKTRKIKMKRFEVIIHDEPHESRNGRRYTINADGRVKLSDSQRECVQELVTLLIGSEKMSDELPEIPVLQPITRKVATLDIRDVGTFNLPIVGTINVDDPGDPTCRGPI
jgi:hypothetical protein